MIRTIRDFDLSGQKVFLRLDFNVPLSKPDADGICTVEDDTRIREALPTIKYALEKRAKVIIASHLGRPNGKRKPEFSLMPAAEKLAELLGTEVTLADDCVGEGIEMKINSMKSGEVLILENLRFHAEEENDDIEFANSMARFTDIYINDAFGTSHREHASVHRLPAQIAKRGIGFLIEKELRYFEPLLASPAAPFYLILGGAKVSDKIKTVRFLLQKVHGVLVGGAMAYAFMKAKGETIPPEWKQPAPEDVEAAKDIIKAAEARQVPLLLPIDTNKGFDIGPKTIQAFNDKLANAKTVFWNGPMGWFEKPEYSNGTFEMASFLSTVSAKKIVGGGDTVSAIHASGFTSGFDHLSTGGGAALEFLEGNGLPGIDVLHVIANQAETLKMVPNPIEDKAAEKK